MARVSGNRLSGNARHSGIKPVVWRHCVGLSDEARCIGTLGYPTPPIAATPFVGALPSTPPRVGATLVPVCTDRPLCKLPNHECGEAQHTPRTTHVQPIHWYASCHEPAKYCVNLFRAGTKFQKLKLCCCMREICALSLGASHIAA